MRMKHDAGLTIIEVLVALVILAVGVMAAAQLQATSMRFSSQAEQIKTATQIAEAEVEWRRQTAITLGEDQTCASYLPDGYTCAATVLPCNASGTGLECATGLVSPVAYRITVSVGSARVSEFSLSTVTTGAYVAGVIGDGSVDTSTEPGEDTGEADGGTGGEEGTPSDDDPRPCLEYAGKSGKCKTWG